MYIPGVIGDDQTSGGLRVAGRLAAGDAFATLVPTIHSLAGVVQIVDSPANGPDDDILCTLDQSQVVLPGDSPDSALFVRRRGNTAQGDYQGETVSILDTSASAQDAFNVRKTTGTGKALSVNGPATFDGVIGEHGKAPAASPTAITGTITAATLSDLTAIVLQLLQALDAKGSITNSAT